MSAIVNFESFVKGQYGTFTIIDGNISEHNVECHAIQVDSAAVFSRLEINGATGSDVRTTYLSSAGGTVQPTLITAGEGNYFSAVTMASGQVTLLKKLVE